MKPPNSEATASKQSLSVNRFDIDGLERVAQLGLLTENEQTVLTCLRMEIGIFETADILDVSNSRVSQLKIQLANLDIENCIKYKKRIKKPGTKNNYRKSARDKLHKFKHKFIISCLNKHEGNRTQTAKDLGMSLRGLRYYLKKYGEEI